MTDVYVVVADSMTGPFTALGDTPSSYSGEASKFVKVKSDETGLEFVTSSASVAWGAITGTLADQTDLQAALDAKQDVLSEGAFVDGDKTKLDGIETSADVTDTANVTAAGALMDSEVSSLSGIKTLTVPDNTTISSFGATLVDDASASAARTTLGLNSLSSASLTPSSSLIIGNGLGGWEMVTPANFITNNNILDTGDIGVSVQAYDANLPTWPSTVDATEVGYLNGVTSAIQTQLDAKLAAGDNITDLDGTAWRVLYINGTGDVTELAFGTSGQVLTSNGATSAPTFETPAGGGDMSASTYDPASISEQLVGLTATQTLTNKTLTSPNINEAVALTATATELNILDGATLSTTELNYVDGVTSNIQTQLDADVNTSSKNFVRTETAGENVSAGDVCYLNSDGKYWKADASAESTADTELLLANATILADASGEFIELGEYTTTGLTAGSVYYLSETAAAFTATAPTTSSAVVRIVGYALSTTVLKFKPDISYIVLA